MKIDERIACSTNLQNPENSSLGNWWFPSLGEPQSLSSSPLQSSCPPPTGSPCEERIPRESGGQGEKKSVPGSLTDWWVVGHSPLLFLPRAYRFKGLAKLWGSKAFVFNQNHIHLHTQACQFLYLSRNKQARSIGRQGPPVAYLSSPLASRLSFSPSRSASRWEERILETKI